EDPPVMAPDELCGEQAHVAGKADDVRPDLVERRQDGRLVFRLAGIVLALEYACRNAERFGPGQPAGRWLIGNDTGNLGRPFRSLARLGEREHVGAAAGDEDDDALAAGLAGRWAHRLSVPS